MPRPNAVRALAACVAAALAVAVALLSLAPARAASTGQLRQSITAKQGTVSSLTGRVGAANQRVHALGGSIAALSAQVTRLQTDLDAKRLALLRLRTELAAAHTRLTALQAAQARAEDVLAHQLIGSYEADRPDIVSVVLESTGFNNLLERLAFAQRIRNQDTRITSQVKASRRAVAQEAIRLGALTVRQQRLTADVLRERNQVDATRLVVVRRQIAAIAVRDRVAGQLQNARGSLATLHRQLTHLIAAQAAAAAARARAQQQASTPSSPSSSAASPGTTGAPAAPVTPSSSGGFTFPMPRAAASPPGTWSLDDGVDISAPGNTPLLAVCSGTVVLHGIGGFGPSAPVIHCDQPLSGYSYVYYGHAGPGNWTPVGTHVSQGQVVSEVGAGIVGISTGPHLEIGFASSAGGPVGPSSAPAMSALLHAAYGG
ncbi:MAG TPA: peptidoglycan DD-metalloendopeptidase family protein [Solirubrobacteraceae bacterium]|nr:peptidoglycan DD-metalloendopeptidase family protein [Solirubrobacteraceae bacterium]